MQINKPVTSFFSSETKKIIILLTVIGLFIYISILNERIATLRFQNDAYSAQMKSLRGERVVLEAELAAKTKERQQQDSLIAELKRELSNLPTDESIKATQPIPLNINDSWDEILQPIEFTLYGLTLLPRHGISPE